MNYILHYTQYSTDKKAKHYLSSLTICPSSVRLSFSSRYCNKLLDDGLEYGCGDEKTEGGGEN